MILILVDEDAKSWNEHSFQRNDQISSFLFQITFISPCFLVGKLHAGFSLQPLWQAQRHVAGDSIVPLSLLDFSPLEICPKLSLAL